MDTDEHGSRAIDLETTLLAWAQREPAIQGLVLIGSRARAAEDGVWRADAASDWDFQVITSKPEWFTTKGWTEPLGLKVRACAARQAAIGGVPKAAALFEGAEADFVILPSDLLARLRERVARGEHRNCGDLTRTLQDLAVVIRPGWRFLKGADEWGSLYDTAARDITDLRLSNRDIEELEQAFACDAVWVLRKIQRGELIAAQRMLHRSLLETNLRLLHELRLRRGERSFPEGRRAERVLDERSRQWVSVSAELEATSLRKALAHCEEACRAVVAALGNEKEVS